MKLKNIRLLISNPRFLSLILLSAIPNKICLTGFLYFILPLYLKFLGNSQSGTGRILMSYGFAIVFLSPISGSLSDRFKNRKMFVALGACVSSLGLLSAFFFHNIWVLFLATAVLGIGHSLSLSSQLALVTEVCKREENQIGLMTVMGIFRFLERAGNISGPILAGLLVSFFSYPSAIAIMGTMTLLAGLSFSIIFRTPLPAPMLEKEATV